MLVAGALSYLMYQKDDFPWNRTMNIFLASFRFLVITAIMILLLNPLINQIINETERPQVAIAIDNSSSMVKNEDSVTLNNLITDLKGNLETDGFEVSQFSLSGDLEEGPIGFDEVKTDISLQLRNIDTYFEGRNLGTIVLVSDGIYNRGTSPLYKNVVYPIHTVGIGDTIPPQDIGIVEVNTNQIAYQGNKFPIEVLINNSGYQQGSTTIRLKQSGNVIDSKVFNLSSNQVIRFETEANNPGLTRYSLEIDPVSGEQSLENNEYDIYIDVVEGKERILLVGQAPHPDIRAIRNALRDSENYETFLFIPGISELDRNLNYDVVIVHHAFSHDLIPEDLKGNPSFWFILGDRSDLSSSLVESGINVLADFNQRDNVKPAFNTSFSKFQMDREYLASLASYPSIQVPFGDYEISGPVETLLYQQVGSIITQKPLFSFYDDGSKRTATIYGSGIWKWALQESAFSENNENFKQLVLKTIQYLSVRTDKRRFRFNPLDRIFIEGEAVKFSSESYNDIYERVGGNEINVTIENESGSRNTFKFTANADNNILTAGSLSEGIYSFTAATTIGNKAYSSSGEFLVKKIHLENLALTANFQLLKDLASKTGGQFYNKNMVNQISGDITELELKNIIRSNQNYFPLINMILVIILVITFISLEWGLRKYYGSY